MLECCYITLVGIRKLECHIRMPNHVEVEVTAVRGLCTAIARFHADRIERLCGRFLYYYIAFLQCQLMSVSTRNHYGDVRTTLDAP